MSIDVTGSVNTGGEVTAESGQMISPPSLKTSEFAFDTGNEISLPKPGDDPEIGFERLIDENDLLPVWFLEQGAVAQRAVARVVLTQPHTVDGSTFPPGTGWATGFMVSSSLFLTNNHVIPDTDFAAKIRMQFNFQVGADGMELPTQSFFPVVDDAFHTNPALDYTLTRLQPAMDGNATVMPGERWGMVQLNQTPTFRDKQHFNVIQHPSGEPKKVALQDNELAKLFINVVRYKSDTEPGSSGSPVFDNLWRLVALHHAGGDQDANGKWLNNQGIRIDRIIDDLRGHFTGPIGQTILAELGI